MEKQGKQGVIIFALIFGLMWFSAKENSLTSPVDSKSPFTQQGRIQDSP